MRMPRGCRWVGIACLVAACGWNGAATAADLYFAGNLSTSSASGTAGGSTDFFTIRGSDRDSSPIWGATLGLGFALNEVNPDGWGSRMPAVSLRVELEGLVGRDYEFQVGDGTGSFFSKVRTWTMMSNVWLDVPFRVALERFVGRTPVLEPLSLYLGAGMGLARVRFETTDNVSSGSQDAFNFAWHGGAGLAYELTEWVTITAGYRYVHLGRVEAELSLSPTFQIGTQTLDLQSHEFLSTLRIDFHSAPLDEMLPKRWAWPRWTRPRWLGGE